MSATIYIAGPMRYHRHYNFPAFDAAAELLRARGFTVINPADLDRALGQDPFDFPKDWDWGSVPETMPVIEIARRDIDSIFMSDSYVLLQGWERSQGATAEKAVADWLGHLRRDPATGEPWPGSRPTGESDRTIADLAKRITARELAKRS